MTCLLTFPDSLTLLHVAGLVLTSFVTSMLTAVFGIGGGIALLAAMTQLVPHGAVIPVHAVVQLGSNAGRAALLWRHINWRFIAMFAAGALIGSLTGGRVRFELPAALLQASLGLFILYVLWGPSLPAWISGKWVSGKWVSEKPSAILQGALSSFLTMFLGATGPFVAAALKPRALPAIDYASTFAAAMTIQHGLKVFVFFILGFGYGPYLGLMAAMIICGLLGTVIGTYILKHRSSQSFHIWLNIILTVLALRLLYVAARTYA